MNEVDDHFTGLTVDRGTHPLIVWTAIKMKHALAISQKIMRVDYARHCLY